MPECVRVLPSSVVVSKTGTNLPMLSYVAYKTVL